MKFSSDDVANQRFEVRFRGYDTDQVREFLTVVARELDGLVGEHRRLVRDLDVAHRELADYRKRERSLHDALETARSTAEAMRSKAERDAELRVGEAELEAERIVARAQRAADELTQEMEQLREQRKRATAEMRATLEMHLHLLDSQKQPHYLEPHDLDQEELDSQESDRDAHGLPT